jgi:hypothetical protein
MARTPTDLADRLGKRRALTCLALAVVFFMSQSASLDLTPGNPLPHLYSEAWYLWAALFFLLLVLATAVVRPRSVLGILNDEGTLDHRRRALGAGFWGAIATCGALWFITEPITGSEVARLVVTIAGSTALLRFGWLEWRSFR